MNQPSSEYEPDSTRNSNRINQKSAGDFAGGQQAATGNNNVFIQISHGHPYEQLQDKDLDSLKFQERVATYFGVLIFLSLSLVFWVFFGLFTSYPFPYGAAIELIHSCFTGRIGSRVNHLQKQLQVKATEPQSVEELGETDFQIRLCLGVLDQFKIDNNESRERVAKTIEALKQQRSRVQKKLKNRQPEKYRAVARAQDSFESFILNRANRDLIQVETGLDNTAQLIRDRSQPNAVVREAITKLSQERMQRTSKVSPSSLGIFYKVEALLYEILLKEQSSPEQQNTSYDQENNLRRELFQKQAEIKELNDRIDRYSEIRLPNGRYYGNLSDSKAKYHFNPKCTFWKMLVGDYMLNLDPSREIVNSKDPYFFTERNMDPCDRCESGKD